MNFRQCALIAWVVLIPAVAGATDFGVLHTGQPVAKGVWWLGGGGIAALEDPHREALVLSAGTGLGPKADAEVKWSLSGDDMAIGGDINYLVFNSGPAEKRVDVSVGAGYHYVAHDVTDQNAFDIQGIFSKLLNPKTSLYGALTVSFGSQDVPEGFDGSYTAANLVPGIDYKLNDKINAVVELGIGLNDSATNYIAAGIHYYIR